jgi:hypothetical protein
MGRVLSRRLNAAEKAAVEVFNAHPSESVEQLCAAFNISPTDSKEISHLFLTIYEFDGHKLGEFLVRDQFTQFLADYFFEMDLTGTFLYALRRGLAGPVQLPAEGEGVDRLLEIFARSFYLQNPAVFPTSDVGYVLAYAVMMLNTNLHNEVMMKHRIGKEKFLSQVRDHPLLTAEVVSQKDVFAIFESIKKQPLVYGSSRSELFSPTAERLKGMLKKSSGRKKLLWGARYFVLCHMSLVYYTSESEAVGEPRGLVTLEHVEVLGESDAPVIVIAARPGFFITYTKYINHVAQPVLNVTKIWLRCPTEIDRERWLHRMNEYVVSFEWSEGLRFDTD